jgi:hypothetical protein
MLIPRLQSKNTLNPKDYSLRILITGSATCSSKPQFHDDLCSIIDSEEKDILFMSLNHDRGPENWIKLWCDKNNYPCLIIDKHKDDHYLNILSACNIATDLIVFLTNEEEPFKLYLDLAKKHKLHIRKIRVP